MKVSIRHPTAVYRQARLEALEKSSDRMRTIVIFGAPRGGTTMVAGSCNAAGSTWAVDCRTISKISPLCRSLSTR